MNLLTEFLAFFAWLSRHPKRALEYKGFWVYLLYQNNQSAVRDAAGDWHWPVWFEVDNPGLKAFLNLEDRRQIAYYRGRLIRDGLIDYRKTGGGYQYALKPFDHKTVQTAIRLEDHTSLSVWTTAGENAARPVKDHNPCGFWIPPALSEEERKALALKYPDEVQRFWAEQALREQKAREEEEKWAY